MSNVSKKKIRFEIRTERMKPTTVLAIFIFVGLVSGLQRDASVILLTSLGQSSLLGRLICGAGTPNACGNTISMINNIFTADSSLSFNEARNEYLISYSSSVNQL